MRTFDIVFVPGLRPKPQYAVYHPALLRCIEFGLQRYCAGEAEIREHLSEALRIYAWTDQVYEEYRDITLDQAGIDEMLEFPDPTPKQRNVIDSAARRALQWAHRVGDRVPLLGRAFASERQRVMLSEARDYLRNREGVGSYTRAGLTDLLTEVWSEQRQLIIAFDTLWEMSESSPVRVAGLITIGSPLGTRFVRELLQGVQQVGAKRYPRNIQHWTNIAARGELTALYPRLSNVYAEMLELNLLESLEDHVDVYNHFFGMGLLGYAVGNYSGFAIAALVQGLLG